jgi:hypothetical protein
VNVNPTGRSTWANFHNPDQPKEPTINLTSIFRFAKKVAPMVIAYAQAS